MKRKVLRCGLSLLLVAALVLASCGEVEVVGEQEEEEEEAVPGEQEEEVAEEEEEEEEEEPTPATFTIHDLSISPSEIDIGRRMTISAIASNSGDLAGDYNVIFKINNAAVETVDLTIDGGVSQEVDFATTVEYAAGTYSVDVNGLLGSFTVKEPPPSAVFTITGFDQIYSDLLDEWPKFVFIHYRVQNNGEAHISYYKVWFIATYADGSQSQGWSNGIHIFVGQELPRRTLFMGESKEIISVEIADFELQAGEVPDEITSVEFTITDFDQSYYESLGEWSTYVNVNYTMQNSGEAYLDYYRACIVATCDDGSQHQELIMGQDIFAGERWLGSALIDVSGKKVVSVELVEETLWAKAGTVPEVIYEITGSADEVDVTQNTSSGGTSQDSGVRLPKRYVYGWFSDDFLYISAQNQGESGTVRVTIYLNGKVFKSTSSSGAYVIATASGSK